MKTKLVSLMALASMSGAAWLATCPAESLAGADVARAHAKGNRARILLNQCVPDRALVADWSRDFHPKGQQ